MFPSILVLEENDDGITILKDRLERWGYRVTAVKYEIDAINQLKTNEFAGIIYELNIRGAESLIALSEFHQMNPHIPILAMSEETRRMALIEALEQGASDYIVKPIDFDLLKTKCQRLFE